MRRIPFNRCGLPVHLPNQSEFLCACERFLPGSGSSLATTISSQGGTFRAGKPFSRSVRILPEAGFRHRLLVTPKPAIRGATRNNPANADNFSKRNAQDMEHGKKPLRVANSAFNPGKTALSLPRWPDEGRTWTLHAPKTAVVGLASPAPDQVQVHTSGASLAFRNRHVDYSTSLSIGGADSSASPTLSSIRQNRYSLGNSPSASAQEMPCSETQVSAGVGIQMRHCKS